MTGMQVKLTSRQYEILDYGTVFLFDENADLTLNIIADNSFEFILSISFINDISREQSLDTEISENCIKLTYYGMNILDYLVGNIDRHPGNWGFLVDNKTNECVSLYPIMDFNQSFGSYDTIDGANCQTAYPQRVTQREAAIEAVKQIGLCQNRDINENIFAEAVEWKDMFFKRLEELKKYCG